MKNRFVWPTAKVNVSWLTFFDSVAPGWNALIKNYNRKLWSFNFSQEIWGNRTRDKTIPLHNLWMSFYERNEQHENRYQDSRRSNTEGLAHSVPSVASAIAAAIPLGADPVGREWWSSWWCSDGPWWSSWWCSDGPTSFFWFAYLVACWPRQRSHLEE